MFRDEQIAGEDVRVAYQFLQPPDGARGRFVLLQVAETRNKRSTLASGSSPACCCRSLRSSRSR
jgi:two-component system sensor histidine kinase TctE